MARKKINKLIKSINEYTEAAAEMIEMCSDKMDANLFCGKIAAYNDVLYMIEDIWGEINEG